MTPREAIASHAQSGLSPDEVILKAEFRLGNGAYEFTDTEIQMMQYMLDVLGQALATIYQPVSSAARQAYIDGIPEAELRQIDQEQARHRNNFKVDL